MNELITIGISDMKVTRSPGCLVTYALGSCVGICLYDSAAKLAGLAHIMLPHYTEHNGANRLKFADTCIPIMVDEMVKLGCLKSRLTAKIAGGAKMFQVPDESALGNIGDRNVIAVRQTLKLMTIPIVAEDVGKNFGRTVFFNAETGKVEVKSYTRELLTL